jgi:hypothetical protein
MKIIQHADCFEVRSPSFLRGPKASRLGEPAAITQRSKTSANNDCTGPTVVRPPTSNGINARHLPRSPLVSASIRILAVGFGDLFNTPFRALNRIARELGRKLGDRRFDRPFREPKLVQPLESALNVAALD